MLNRDEIKDFFRLEGSHAKKELGQNFLCNQKTINEIVSLLNLDENDSLLEIGPGLGALTNDLIGKTKKYTVVEYDAKFVDYLSRAYENQNIEIVKSNILKFKNFDFNKVVGNLPYYITSEIILYIALNFKKTTKAVFMMQQEAYKRITADFGTKDYNVLNVIIDYTYKITRNMIVQNTSFFPMPNVNSVVVSFERRKNIDNDFVKPLLTATRAMFLNRRKTLMNNLNSLVKDKNKAEEILNNLSIASNCRAEELKVADFVNLTHVLLDLGVIKY